MESAAIHSSEVHEVDSGIPMTLFKGFSTSLSLLQGELHLSHQASLPSGTRGCNRPTVLNFLPLRLSCKESSTFSPSPSQWSLHPLRFPRSRGTETSGSGDVTAHFWRARNRYALRLSDRQRSRHILRDGTAWMRVPYN